MHNQGVKMPPEEDLKKRVGRKLTKKRREGHTATMDIPERFRDGEDADEDCSAPKGSPAQFMNQSVFGMIAAAGSQVDFNARFDGQSSDEEDAAIDPSSTSYQGSASSLDKLSTSQATLKPDSKHRRKFSENKLLKSLPHLSMKSSKSKREIQRKDTAELSSPTLDEPPTESPATETTRTSTRQAPVMSQMLEARAQLESRPSFDLSEKLGNKEWQPDSADGTSSSLALRLKDIFAFEDAEEVIQGSLGKSRLLQIHEWLIIQEYPCWLMQSVLLQGYLYITSKHICFYAYLPKKSVSCHRVIVFKTSTNNLQAKRNREIRIPCQTWPSKSEI
jgi:sterol 3beta-glucosyltransferase